MAEQSNYKVKADLVLGTTKAQSQAVQMQKRIQDLGRRISGTNSMAGGLTRNLIAMGGAYLGINVLTRAFAGATRGAMVYTGEIEKTKIALTSVLAAVKNTDWETAQKTSGKVFEQLRTDSIKSVATAQELFGIYQGIVGPISAAGKGLDVVRTITKDAVNASGVLGVDLEQAQRDISMMARGTAGADVKLFSMLRSTGAIAETTEEWNNNLSAGDRIDKLQAALAKFAPSGERFAKSWGGVTSTFKGIRQEFSRSAMAPVMDAMAASLGRINDILIGNQDEVQARLQAWGQSFATRLAGVFKTAENGVNMLVNHWDEVLAKIDQIQGRMKTIGKVAAVGAAAQAARPLVGAAVGGVGAIAGAMAAAPATAAGATGAAAGAAAGGGGMAALGPAMAVAAGAAGALAGAVMVVQEQWDSFMGMFRSFRPIFIGLGGDLSRLGVAIWTALAPALKVAGHLLMMVLVPAFTAAVLVIRTIVSSLATFVENISWITNAIYDLLLPAFNAIWRTIDLVVTKVTGIINAAFGDTFRYNQRKIGGADEDALGALGKRFGQGDYTPAWDPSNFKDQAGAPGARSTVVNDFRGSKIEVKQTFRDQDPDRVMVAMVEGLARQAEMRLQSGMVPALGR